MKTEKTINLTAYMVEYIDQREPKPRTVHTQTVVLDGGKISALARLDMRPAGWILADLWQQTAAQIERDRLKAQLQAALAQLNSQEVEA